MGLATLMSRLLGLVREMIYARVLGDGLVKGAFDYAFMIPNLFRRLLGEGALTASFIPIFKKKEKEEGEIAMWESANAVISGLIIASALIIGLTMIGLTVTLSFARLSSQSQLMLELLRLMFPYMFFVCLAATFMGMLNARGFFFIPALGATLLNVVMISTVLIFVPMIDGGLEEKIFALGYGVLVAGIAQAGFQLPYLYKNGYRWKFVNPLHHPTTKEVLKKMIPGTIGVAAFQINMLVTQGIAFWMDGTQSEGSIVASFMYAVRLMEFPQGVFGVSLFTFLLTSLSGFVADKNYDQFRSTLNDGINYLVFVNIFAAVFTVIMAEPIVRLVFEGGAFDRGSSHRASLALMCLAPSLISFSLVGCYARGFYALGDVKTPMYISVFCLLINLILTIILIKPYRQAGLGIANTLTSFLNAALILYAIRLKLKKLDWGNLPLDLGKMVLCAGVAGQVVWALSHYVFSPLIENDNPAFILKIAVVFVPMVCGFAIYWGLCTFLRLKAPHEISQTLLKYLNRKQA